ncbi:MAG: hypothetical protein ACRDJW_20265 [Thermomicrobiales bacterium]
MASLPRVIDVESAPDLLRLVEDVRETHEELVIRQGGESVAVLSPTKAELRKRSGRVITEDDIEAARSAAGSWEGLIDADKFIEDVYASRSPIRRRRPRRAITEADIEAFRSAAGGWKDVDTDKLLEDIYADRDLGDRPPVIF